MTDNPLGLTSTKVLGYIRRSKDAKATDASPKMQEAAIYTWAERHGLTVEKVYSDYGRSGFKRGVVREEWDALLARMDQGGIGAVVAYRSDRFTRQGVLATLELWARGERAGTAFLSATEPQYDSRAKGVASILSLMPVGMAEEESKTIAGRVGGAKKATRDSGGYVGGPAPFGYQTTRNSQGVRILIPEPREAAILREVVDGLLVGDSITGWVRRLNSEGRLNAQGREWSRTYLRVCLRNPTIAGYLVTRPDPKHPSWEIVQDEVSKDLVQRWEPIIGPAKFWELQRMLAKHARPIASDKAFLGGRDILFCARCGGPLGGVRMRRQPDIYRCSRVASKKCASGVNIDRLRTDAWVRNIVIGLATNLDIANVEDHRIILGAARAFNATLTDPLVEARRAAISDELATINANLEKARYDHYETDLLDDEEYAVTARRLKERKRKAETALAGLPSGLEYDPDGLMQWLEGLRAIDPDDWDETNFFTLARYFLRGVVVLPYRVEQGRGNVDARLLPIFNEAPADIQIPSQRIGEGEMEARTEALLAARPAVLDGRP